MKIGLNTNNVINMYTNNSKNSKVENKNSKNNDRVEISSHGREISKYIENARDTEMQNKRVEEIKTQLNSGTYKVDSEKLAKSILEHLKGSDI